jgi:TetR/AcrR family transcriptional regulator, regulator of autoinduction and epiphytic fitness
MLAPVEPDGRTLRRLRSYERAVDAVLDLIGEGVASPTAQQVAQRSGISIRTVFRLTEDVESLHAAAVQRQTERITPLYVPLSPAGSLGERISALVENRATIFETIAPVRRVAERLALTSAPIADQLGRNRRLLRSQVSALFRAELTQTAGITRRDLLNALDVAASWETWDQLRRVKELSRPDAERTVHRLIEGALTPCPSATS